MDFAIIQGTCLPFKEKSNKENLIIWVERIETAFIDVKMIFYNNDSLKLYLYTKKTFLYAMLYKIILFEDEFSDAEIPEALENWLEVIPAISWEIIFLLVYKIGLVSELVVICKEIRKESCENVINMLELFLNKIIHEESTLENFKLNKLDLISFLCAVNFEMSNSNVLVKNDVFLEILNNLTEHDHFYNEKCSHTAIKCIRECMSSKIKVKNTVSFHRIFELQRILKSLNGDNFDSFSEDLLITSDANNNVGNDIQALKPKFVEVLNKIKNNVNSKEFCGLLEELLQVEQTTKETNAKDCIKFGLNGYQEIASNMLKNLGNDSENKLVTDTNILLQNPNSIANVDNLNTLLSSIHQIETKITPSCLDALWKLFFESFNCLSLKSRLLYLKNIVDMQLIQYLNSKEIANSSNKTINAFLNQLDTNKVTDKQLSEFCYIFIQSPQSSMEKLVSQSINNPQQQDCLLDIFEKLPFIFKLKFSTKFSHFHKEVLDLLKHFWSQNELTQIETTLDFLEKIMKLDCSVSSTKDLLSTCIASLFSSKTDQKHETVLELELVLKIIIRIQSANTISSICSTKDMFFLCLEIAILIESKMQLCASEFSTSHVTCKSLLEQATDALIPDLCNLIEKELQGEKINLYLLWLENKLKLLNWTTQLYFCKLFKFFSKPYIEVPSCIKDVCVIQENSVLMPSENINYGNGTGLMAWLQCFAIMPSMCPISKLNIHSCSMSDLVLFEKGWSITLCQLLPFSSPLQIQTLVNASRVLVMQELLYIKFDTTANNIPLLLDLNQCRIPLSLLQLLANVNLIMLSKCCEKWMSPEIILYYVKHYCQIISNIISDYPEFSDAGLFEQLFILVQAFDFVLQTFNLLQKLQSATHQTLKFVFMLALDLLSNFGQTMLQTPKEEYSIQSEDSTEMSGSFELESFYSQTSQFFFISSLIDIMRNGVQVINDANKCVSLGKKIDTICENL